MSVSRLLVEGNLDAEVLGPLLAGKPVVLGGSPKGSLPPRTRDLRLSTRQPVCYVRDRDFDFLPSTDLNRPSVDQTIGSAALGWRWCRHEIENYLIDPGIVHAALGWDRAVFEGQLVASARSIKHYQAARWTVGQSRQILPPARELPTRPPECTPSEFRLPTDLSPIATAAWVQTQAADFLADVQTILAPSALTAALDNYTTKLTEEFLADIMNVLVWCSGKDLLAGLIPWLRSTHKIHPSQLRTRVRDWIIDNPDRTLSLLPEWDALRNLLRAYP